jgi:hypothetical protein
VIGKKVNLDNDKRLSVCPEWMFLVYEEAYYKPLKESMQERVRKGLNKMCLVCSGGNLKPSSTRCKWCNRQAHATACDLSGHGDACKTLCVVCEKDASRSHRCGYCGRLFHGKVQGCKLHEEECFRFHFMKYFDTEDLTTIIEEDVVEEVRRLSLGDAKEE